MMVPDPVELRMDMAANGTNVEPVHQIVFEKEPLFTRLLRKVKKVFKNITLEPVLLFMSIVGSMDSVSVGQLLIDKSCHIDFEFSDQICDNLLNDTFEHENAEVENEVAQYKVYESIVDHLFPILCSFFLGSWSDTFGRKIILYIYFIFRLVEGSFLLLNAYFIDWPKEYLLFSVNLPVAISGGYLAYSMGINAFVADISKPDQRSFRMAMMHFVSSVGRPIGTQLGSYLFEEGGYICVIGATLVGRAIGFILIVARLETFNWKPRTKEVAVEGAKKRHALSPSHIMDSIRTATKPRPNGKRMYLWIYLIVLISVFLPFFGEGAIGFNYVRTRYSWGVQEYSDYRTITEIIDIIGQSICIPLLAYLQIRDSLLIPFLLCTIVARDFVKGFASVPWMYTFGSAINIMGGYAFSASRSIISKCVEDNELGKIFALLSSAESLVPIGMSQAYASLWKATSELDAPWVGTVFFLSGTITSIAVLISVLSLFSLKGQSIGELDEEPAKLPQYRGPRPGMHTVLRTGAWARLPPSMMDKERRNAAFDLTDAGEILETEKDIKENIKTISGDNA